MIEKKHRLWVAIALIALSIIGASVLSWAATQRQLTSVEAVLLQAFSLGSGLLASFVFGQLSAEQAGRDLIRHHAKSAFRRVLSLYRSLSRLAAIIEAEKENTTARAASSRATLEKLEAIVIEQISTADDALADWSDICPDEVKELISVNNFKPNKEHE
jgi:hypothetical protein